MKDLPESLYRVKEGDEIRFSPPETNRLWAVRKRTDKYIILTRQAVFHKMGTVIYTVVYDDGKKGLCSAELRDVPETFSLTSENIRRISDILDSGTRPTEETKGYIKNINIRYADETLQFKEY